MKITSLLAALLFSFMGFVQAQSLQDQYVDKQAKIKADRAKQDEEIQSQIALGKEAEKSGLVFNCSFQGIAFKDGVVFYWQNMTGYGDHFFPVGNYAVAKGAITFKDPNGRLSELRPDSAELFRSIRQGGLWNPNANQQGSVQKIPCKYISGNRADF